MSELNAIRAKYDPGNEWNEATSLPEAYEREVAFLSEYGRLWPSLI
jgi:hypothetical protein